jgi:hypothetical protein
MAGLLDFLFQGQGGGGLLGLSPQPQSPYVNTDSSGVLGSLRGALNQIANPQSLPDAYEQERARQAGMAMLGALPGGNQPPQQPSSFGAIGPGASYAAPVAPPQYQPMIAQAAQKYGLPADVLTRQLKQESGFNPNAVSPAGATGIAQFMPGTAKDMGVNPLDPASAIDGGARYLAQNRDKFGGDMTKALAAYNWGPANVEQWSAAGGDFSKLPRETQNYITKVAGGPPTPASTQSPPPGSPMTNQPGAGLQLVDSPALQGMPDTVRKAIPLMLQSKTMAPQAMTLIQKYINPDQWQMWRDNMGNVFTRNSATGESKPLLTPTPDMMNANASGMKSPFEYQAATQFSGSAAKNTELTPEQKNAAASPNPTTGVGMTPAQYEGDKAQSVELAKNWVKKYETTVDAGTAARQTLPQLALAKNIVQTDPNFYSGIGDNYNLALKKIWVAAGGDPNTAASQELVGKVLSGQIVSGLRTAFGGLGQVRVAELNALQNSLASKSNTPQALAALITMSEKTQQRAADIADIAQGYNNGSGKLDAGFDRAVSEYDRSHPMFSPQEIANYKKIAEVPAKAQPANPYETEMRRRGLLQ